MARYDYHCKQCDETKEVEHGMRDVVEIRCGQCYGLMEKIITPTNFQLKGKGWFKDGY